MGGDQLSREGIVAGLDNKNLAPELRAFAEYLRELAERTGLTQRQLASEMETTPSTLSRILTGRRLPSLKWLRHYQDWISQYTESGLSAEERNRGRELLYNAALTRNGLVHREITLDKVGGTQAVDDSAIEQLLDNLRPDLAEGAPRGSGSAEPTSDDARPRLRAVPFGSPLTGPAGATHWGVWGQVDGQPVLATGGDDGSVRLWDPRARAPIGDPLTGHDGSVNWGVWGRFGDQPLLATGGDDGSVLVESPCRWRVPR
jgi:transcriptional regulator with XRE-family HTH domain